MPSLNRLKRELYLKGYLFVAEARRALDRVTKAP
jgi:hypothetical protein